MHAVCARAVHVRVCVYVCVMSIAHKAAIAHMMFIMMFLNLK